MNGYVFDIQRFSLHDGPGIRTTVFLNGCSLHCAWCHNPEGMLRSLRLRYADAQCIRCGACVAACPNGAHTLQESGHAIDREKCTLCGACIAVCPSRALSKSGQEYTPEQIADAALRDLAFYGDNGGVTFSGGEPLLQAEFVAETARLCKERGVPSVFIDTAGAVERSAFLQVLPYVDGFLYDVKAGDDALHRQWTGQDAVQSYDNLCWLDAQGKSIYVRIPVVPSVNDNDEEMTRIADRLAPLRSVREVRLIPYHTFGREKYATLGLPVPPDFGKTDEAWIASWQKKIQC